MAFYDVLLATLLVQNKGLENQNTEETEQGNRSFSLVEGFKRDIGLS